MALLELAVRVSLTLQILETYRDITNVRVLE